MKNKKVNQVGKTGEIRVGIYKKEGEVLLLEDTQYFKATKEAAIFCDSTNTEGSEYQAYIEGEVV